jgi:hypothetical protein
MAMPKNANSHCQEGLMLAQSFSCLSAAPRRVKAGGHDAPVVPDIRDFHGRPVGLSFAMKEC